MTALDAHVDWLRAREYAPGSISLRRRYVNGLADFLAQHDCPLLDPDPQLLRDWTVWLHKNRRLGVRTRASQISNARARGRRTAASRRAGAARSSPRL